MRKATDERRKATDQSSAVDDRQSNNIYDCPLN